MSKRVWVIIAIVVSIIIGLLGSFVGVMNIFTHWCEDDCGSTALRITFGVIQLIAGLLLLLGAYFAARSDVAARVVWIAAIVVSILAFFWAPVILLPALILIGVGVWAVGDRSHKVEG